jgi:magnesium-protoporphyrin O-methyltransferase
MSAVSCVSLRATVAPKAVAKRDGSKPAAARRPTPVVLAAPAFAVASLAGPAFAATEALSQTADGVGIAVGGLAAVAAVGGLLIATDPNKRRDDMKSTAGGDEAKSVADYFNSTGFERWNKIYGETDDVNKVQMDIRVGHQQTVDKVLNWTSGMDMNGTYFPFTTFRLPDCPQKTDTFFLQSGVTVCDAGCGTGSLAIPLALRGASIAASDISSAMVGEAEERYNAEISGGKKAPGVAPNFQAIGLEECSGKYNVVTCIDVMIHYPTDRVNAMISHLASLSDDKLIISFAPKTLAYTILKRIGELFPGPSKATRAYLHKEEDVEAALNAAGFKVKRREMTATQFYYSRLLECERA